MIDDSNKTPNESPAPKVKKADYSNTLNLPRTDFPMKADLPRREPEIQKYWETIKLYQRSLEKHSPRGVFILHDGPPYSNGNIHVGTALQNKVPKDVTTRYRTLRGYCAPYVPGWDNHGMPIENAVSQEFRKKKIEPTRLELRQACRKYAQTWVDIQREQFKRMGIRGDWDNPYLTMDPAFEAKIVEVFGELVAHEFVYRGLRPIHWCPNCRTAIAGAEIEYDEQHISRSIFVRFRASADLQEILAPLDLSHCYTVIWTTTPWTIPANMAVAVNPELDYVVVSVGEDYYLLADGLAVSALVRSGLVSAPEGQNLQSLTLDDLRIVVKKRFRGTELQGLKFRHPLYTRDSVLVLGDHVTLDAGTGVVHTAPGHGIEDFVVGQKYHLPALCPVDERGVFTSESGRFEGIHIEKGNQAVLDALNEVGALLREEPFQHSYPTCWRCKGPVIFRATVQWFLNMEHLGHRQKCIHAIDERVKWYPAESADRIRAYVANRPDWCLSRQRAWGVGIPVVYCEECHNPVVTAETIALVAAAIRKTNSDAWFEKDVTDFLPKDFVCPLCGGSSFRKDTDTLSVWFDSGSSCRAVLEQRAGLHYPADVYMEGYDQLRAWFNESLMIGMATRGAPPYRAVVAHGFTVDENGRKMSKSIGNVIDPTKLMQTYGADILRWMAMSMDYWADMRLGEKQLKQSASQYVDIRNRFRFMLSNLFDFNLEKDRVPTAQMSEIDRWAMHRLQELIGRVTQAYDGYEYHIVAREIYQFLSMDMSAFYLDIAKDCLYTSLPDDPARRSAQTALYELTRCLAIMLSPILVHTMEEVWTSLPGALEQMCSVHLCDFPVVQELFVDKQLSRRWEPVLEVRKESLKAIDVLRRNKEIRRSQDSALILKCKPGLAAELKDFKKVLPGILLVSSVEIQEDESVDRMEVLVRPADGVKCERCWNVFPSVGSDLAYPALCNRCAETVRDWPVDME